MVIVYVIRSLSNGKRYVGISADLGPRLRAHARRSTKGGQQLGRFEFISTEEYANYAEARVREKFLKSGKGRAWLDCNFGRRSKERDVDTARLEATVPRSVVRGVA